VASYDHRTVKDQSPMGEGGGQKWGRGRVQVKWPPILDRMQQMYGDNAMEPQPNSPKIVRKVLAAAIKRRQTLGMSQSPLETGKNGLQVHGIIYCIINTRS